MFVAQMELLLKINEQWHELGVWNIGYIEIKNMEIPKVAYLAAY